MVAQETTAKSEGKDATKKKDEEEKPVDLVNFL
jgi:hypothetical protein